MHRSETLHGNGDRDDDLALRVCTNHTDGCTVEGRVEMGERVIINIKTFDDGHRPPDLVVPAML